MAFFWLGLFYTPLNLLDLDILQRILANVKCVLYHLHFRRLDFLVTIRILSVYIVSFCNMLVYAVQRSKYLRNTTFNIVARFICVFFRVSRASNHFKHKNRYISPRCSVSSDPVLILHVWLAASQQVKTATTLHDRTQNMGA